MATVGERLREMREATGLSQEALGRKLAVAGATISRYESGETHIKADELPRFANALGQSPCSFFEDRPERVGVGEWEPSRMLPTLSQEFAERFVRLTPRQLAVLDGLLRVLEETGVE